MGLKDYQAKRDFRRTPEPRGAVAASQTGRLYAIQKHDARQLHYDLRLEHEGVLLSWAVPKGPSLDPREKRLAVHVEDHPVAYGDFEGVIPEGYGAGTVMLWDTGTWEPIGDFAAALAAGKPKFILHGQKLRGAWTLVRMKGQAGEGDKNWLLIKERDGEVRNEDDYSVIDREPLSVATGRKMSEIAAARDRTWTTAGVEGAAATQTHEAPAPTDVDIAGLPGARQTAWPKQLTPQHASETRQPPAGDKWLHEIALRGVRMLALLRDGEIQLVDDDGHDRTRVLRDVARAAARWPIENTVLDGVVVALGAGGATDRATLDESLASGRSDQLQYHVFDLPYCGGYDLRKTPLLERKQLLQRVLATAARMATASEPRSAGSNLPAALGGVVYYGDHVLGHGATVFAQAAKLGAPGIISKQIDSPYTGRRTKTWLHARIEMTREGEAPAEPPLATSRTGAAPVTAVEPGFVLLGVRVTHPDRVLYPEEEVTKRTLAEYYAAVAERMLPHVAGRPLSLFRCPRGYEHESFFQKHLGDATYAHLREAPVRGAEGKEPYIALDDVAGLVTLAQLSVLEVHPWGCREDAIEKPDRLIFDLDPDPALPWRQLVAGARQARDLLAEHGLQSWVKTSGGKGLHVVVPFVRHGNWEQIKTFTMGIAKELARRHPQRFVASLALWARQGKIFVDYLRNVRGATCVAPYSPRARAGATVSAPLHWEELDTHPIVYTINSLPRRLAMLRVDPWDGFLACRQSLER